MRAYLDAFEIRFGHAAVTAASFVRYLRVTR
jgi:hypothetical protein